MGNKLPLPKMSDSQAEKMWKAMSFKEKKDFVVMYQKLVNGELMLKHVNVDDNEVIQNIVLEPKDKPSKPIKPFMEFFKE